MVVSRFHGNGCYSRRTDGLMIEVHNDPESALCDGAQSLKPKKYDELLKQVAQIANVVGKSI